MSARLLVLPKFLRCSQARKANFLFQSARAHKKVVVLGMLANAHKDHLSPLIEKMKIIGIPFYITLLALSLKSFSI